MIKKGLRNRINQFISIIIFSLLLLGCLTPKKMDGWIGEYESVPNKLKTSDYITIKTGNIPQSNEASVSQKGNSKFIPAIFYWKSEQTIISNLNPFIPVNNIATSIINYANAKGLRQKLNGQKIEISLGKVPEVFTTTHRYQLYFFVVFYVQREYFFVSPQQQDITFNYKILKDNAETKNGTITITDPGKPVKQKFFQSVKKMTGNYLEKYDDIINAMSKELVDKILLEIKG